MNHYWKNVPSLGNVAVSRHAQDKAIEDHISDAEFESALMTGIEAPDGMGTVTRTKGNVRIVILLRPTPFRGAKLVTTVFRLLANGKAK